MVILEDSEEFLEELTAQDDVVCLGSSAVKVADVKLALSLALDGEVLCKSGKRHSDVVLVD